MKTSIEVQELPWVSQQILHHLSTCLQPQTLIDLTVGTGASYCAVSTAARLLTAQGFVERLKVRGHIAYRLAPLPEVVDVRA